ncbi:hypothetical protein I7I48_11983 [Histoplasma ohiense]|nr:hypothetical protein I7I48_11983 [Histoplasma ohiense (nom. inval.)]
MSSSMPLVPTVALVRAFLRLLVSVFHQSHDARPNIHPAATQHKTHSRNRSGKLSLESAPIHPNRSQEFHGIDQHL